MIFFIITILSLLILVLGLSWYEYKGINQKNRKEKVGYFPWLFSKKSRLNPMLWKKQGTDFYNRRFIQAYSLEQRWIFVCLAVSFLYLGLSGFIFALFLPGRIRGIPLILHMIAGGVFGLTLGAVVILRARYHNLTDINNPATRTDMDLVLLRISFWIFVLSGLLLILSALFMMTPFFSLAAQLLIFSLHQYSALASVLAAFAFIYLTPEIRSGEQSIK